MILSKDDIKKADDLKTVIVKVDEWKKGGEVIVRTMTGYARDRFELSLSGKNGGSNMVNIRAKVCAATIVDETGALLFSDKDISTLGNKSGVVLDRIYEAAQNLNKISDKDVEELAKNS